MTMATWQPGGLLVAGVVLALILLRGRIGG